jgi:hypothetical protein
VALTRFAAHVGVGVSGFEAGLRLGTVAQTYRDMYACNR